MRQLLSVPSQLRPILKSARRSSNLTQTGLASRLGISQSRMSAMELHPESMNLDQLLALCGALGLELVIQSKDHGVSSTANPAESSAEVEW